MVSFRSRRVILPEGERPATIRCEGGVMVEVDEGPADHDFGELAILPGLVDAHVHVNEPGRTHWEGFVTATRSALAGGTTTIVDMPLNSIPPTVDVAALAEKRRAARGQVACDVAFWGGIVPGSVGSVMALREAGVCGFKVFTVDSGVPEFPPLPIPEIVGLGDPGLPLLVHAEDGSELRPFTGDPRRYADYLATRPGRAEAAAVEALANSPAHLHILHVAGAEATEAIRRHRGRISAETCPHYLTFDAASIPDGATAYKCAPPIRTGEDREALWEALGDGTLAMVVSDHSPAPPDVKRLDDGDFSAAWGGIASVELRLVATWDGARRRRYRLDRIAEWLAAAPARLAGLDHRKGAIAPGMDADLVVFDPDGETVVDATRLRQRYPVTPYDGMRLAGRVVVTVLGGEIADPDSSRGRLLRRGG